MADYYEFSHVFYKNDDTPGWQLARISGTENAVEKKCKKLFPSFVYFPVIGTEPVQCLNASSIRLLQNTLKSLHKLRKHR